MHISNINGASIHIYFRYITPPPDDVIQWEFKFCVTAPTGIYIHV
jgi:hypothetical protein